MLLQIDLVFEGHIAGRIVGQTVAIETGDCLDHLFGPFGLAGHHQCGQRIEGVEEKMRIHLIS